MGDEIKPTFDFGNLSWGEAKKVTSVQKRVTEAQAAQDQEKLSAAFDEFQAFVAKVLVSMPREWLVRSAPETIDWSNGASIDFLRSDKFNALIEAWTDAQSTDKASGG